MTTDPKVRQAEMQALRDSGMTLKQIGAKFGISRQRVLQVLGKRYERQATTFKCPHCGWEYDPEASQSGWSLVPNHWFDMQPCPGQKQTPRNAASDHRPLWKDEANGAHVSWSGRLAQDKEGRVHLVEGGTDGPEAKEAN